MQEEIENPEKLIISLKQKNEALQKELSGLKNFNRLSLLSDLTFEGVFFHEKGICIEVNQALCNLSGYSRDELIGQDFLELFSTENSRPVISQNMHLEYASPYRVDVRIKNGSIITVELESKFFSIDGKFIKVTAVRDISEKLMAENALADSEERYKIAFKTSPDAININNLEGVYIDINDGFTNLTGFTREDVIGKLSADIGIWAIPAERENLIAGLKKSGLVENLEASFRLKDGTIKTGLMSARLLKFNNELHILSITRDITQRKIIENELLIAKQKAEESDRLKSSFLANMSHEIRTPMNGLVGFVELLIQENLTDEKKMFYKNVINDSCNRLLNIINDILDISKIETRQINTIEEEINLNDFLLETYSFFLPQAKNKNLGMNLIKEFKDGQSTIITDSQKLRQIFNNLLSNSIKFTHEGIIELGYKMDANNEILFYVKDTGIGIPQDQLQLIFDRFRQVDSTHERKYGGTGLGLAIAKGFVELLGGKIWCESKKGEGSTFYFTMPYKAGKNISDKTIHKSQTSKMNSQKTVLVAEDEEINYLYIEELLLHLDNINIIRAINGKEVIELVEKYPEIDLVLMDIKMPLMNGYDATKAIKKSNPNIPIIAQTAYAMPGDEQLALDAGCDAYIKKPIQKDRLIGVVNSFLLKK